MTAYVRRTSNTDKDYRTCNLGQEDVRSFSGKTWYADVPQAPEAKNPPAVLCDFDDTTAVENVAQLLLEHFCENGTRQHLRHQLQERTITLKEYQERAFSNTPASKEAMKAVVQAKATLRPHFKELWEYCQSRQYP